MQKINTTAGFSLRSYTGFSMTELMVVIVIIGILASLSIPRMRAFIAAARQAEAKNNVGLISKLQHLHMSAHEKYLALGVKATGDAAVTSTGAVGYVNATARNCDDAKARRLGFRPSGCNELRYNYFVLISDNNGVDRFIVGAYAPSDANARIFPTCDGSTQGDTGTARVKAVLKHTESTTTWTTLDLKSPGHGDMWVIDDQRKLQSDDIITVCSGASTVGDNNGKDGVPDSS